jgi:hypothetical protein
LPGVLSLVSLLKVVGWTICHVQILSGAVPMLSSFVVFGVMQLCHPITPVFVHFHDSVF